MKSLKRDNLPPMIQSEATNCEARSDEEKAKLFNSYFASVVTDDDYEYFEPPSVHRFGNIQLEPSETEIRAELERLNSFRKRLIRPDTESAEPKRLRE